MTDGHPGRKSRGSETGNHQISCRIASVPQSTASHTSSSARRCHRARLCGRCHDAGADPGVEGREEGLDLPEADRREIVVWRGGSVLGTGGVVWICRRQIGVRLLCVEGESVLEDGERGWIRPEGESA